jgi:hypothetical protein
MEQAGLIECGAVPEALLCSAPLPGARFYIHAGRAGQDAQGEEQRESMIPEHAA